MSRFVGQNLAWMCLGSRGWNEGIINGRLKMGRGSRKVGGVVTVEEVVVVGRGRMRRRRGWMEESKESFAFVEALGVKDALASGTDERMRRVAWVVGGGGGGERGSGGWG